MVSRHRDKKRKRKKSGKLMTHHCESENHFWRLPFHSLAPLVCLRAHLWCGGETAFLWCSLLSEKITAAAAAAIFGMTQKKFHSFFQSLTNLCMSSYVDPTELRPGHSQQQKNTTFCVTCNSCKTVALDDVTYTPRNKTVYRIGFHDLKFEI